MMIIDGSAGATFPDGSVQAAAKPAAPQSMVRVNTANGYGSTNTRIRRFTNVVTNQGSDITYADSATLGASFTINANGVYAISYSDNGTGASYYGLSLSSSQLSTGIEGITVSDRLCLTYAAATQPINCGAVVYLSAGAVIRPHNGAAAANVNSQTDFTITRVA